MNDSFCKSAIIVLNLAMVTTIGWLVMHQDFMFAVNAVVLLLVANIPWFVNRKFKQPFPYQLYLFWITMVSAQVLLSSFRIYKDPTFWYVDEVGHFFGSMVFAVIGFFFLLALDDFKQHRLSLVFIAMFAFTFAMTAEVIWEVIEFLLDKFFQVGAQSGYLLVNGLPVWDTSVTDTMHDLILDMLGAGIFCISVVYWTRSKTKAELEKYIAPIRQYLG